MIAAEFKVSTFSPIRAMGYRAIMHPTLLVDPTCSIDCLGELLIKREAPHFTVVRSAASPTRLEKVLAAPGSFALVDPTSFLTAVAEGAPLVAVWANTKADTRAFLVTQGSDIWTAKQFLDRRLAVKADLRLAIEAVMARNGLPRSRVTVRLSSEPFREVIKGNADAAYGDISPSMRDVAENSSELREIQLSSLGIHFPGDVIVTSEETVDQYADLVSSLVTACAQGWANVFADPARASEFIKLKIRDFDTPITLGAINRQRVLVSPLGARIGELELRRFEELAEALRRDGRVSVAFDFTRILRRDFVDDLYRGALRRRAEVISLSK